MDVLQLTQGKHVVEDGEIWVFIHIIVLIAASLYVYCLLIKILESLNIVTDCVKRDRSIAIDF
jgi:hypothetical protein